MSDFSNASGPPYPYPHPLAPDAENAHLYATSYYQSKINKWAGLVLTPGIVCTVIAVGWNQGRSSEPGDPSLWESNAALAILLLAVGVALILVSGIRIYLLASAKSPHTKLLKAYGVPLDASGTKRVTTNQCR